MYSVNALLAIDAYKLSHLTMYPDKTTKVYANLTARNFKYIEALFPDSLPFFNGKAVVYGTSGSFQEIVEAFQLSFFDQNKAEVILNFKESIQPFIGENSPDAIVSKMEALYDLGYLPLQVKALPEGSMIGPNIPMLTITNTHPDFAWLPNYLETFISSQIWKMSTAATIAKVYKNIFDYYAKKTGTAPEFTLYQGHDFSSRGMSGFVDAARTGSAHPLVFRGSDSVSSVDYLKRYYFAEGYTAGSIPASEHSVMTMGLAEGEKDTFLRILKKFPKGAVAIVSDSYDYWNTIGNIAKELKPDIMARQKDSVGLCKTVFRPDSGDPVDIICGTEKYNINDLDFSDESNNLKPEEKGSVHVLYDTFGGTKTSTGHIQLDEHVGLIYGDSITPQRANSILKKLDEKGFASGNIVLGIGSYTYNYNTRDSLGFAMKATYAEIDGKGVQIFKEPKTDSGKKSAKGMLRVDKVGSDFVLVDCLDNDDGGELKLLFKDGKFYNLPTLTEIRERLETY